MGWFSNTLTTNRINNTTTILNCAALLDTNDAILRGVQEFSSEQITRGNRISGQAFSIQGAGSNLGIQLQRAVGELNSFKREALDLSAELNRRSNYFVAMVEQFSVPRAARQVNLSGKDMTEFATDLTASSLADLVLLAENRRERIAQSVAIIDFADEQLNPGTHIPAAHTLPALAFRHS